MNGSVRLKRFIVEPKAGRTYSMGQISVVTKAELGEIAFALSVTEWGVDSNFLHFNEGKVPFRASYPVEYSLAANG